MEMTLQERRRAVGVEGYAEWNPELTPNFAPRELECRCGCGEVHMLGQVMNTLQTIRCQMRAPLRVSSGYRCPDHNLAVGGGITHPTGAAVDVRICGEEAFDFVALAFRSGFTGIGICQDGPREGRFVHVDVLPESTVSPPRPRIWSY